MLRQFTPKLSFRAAALFLLGGVGVLVISWLALNVTRQLQMQNTASSDNVQWTLSQAEVEFVDFDAKLEQVSKSYDPDLAALRRSFDIFYSRVSILAQASIYADLRALPKFADSLHQIQTFLEGAVPFIDADNAALIASLPELKARTTGLRDNVRELSNSGLNYFANDSDLRRDEVLDTLTELAIGVIVLLIMLGLLAVYLARLNAQNLKRRQEAIQAGIRTRIILDTSLDGVIVCGIDGMILDFNSAAEAIFGYRAQDVLGEELGALIVPDHLRAAHDTGMQRMRDSGAKRVVGKGRVQLEAKRANGEVFPVEMAIQSAETASGEIFIAFLRDISHRVAAEKEVLAARDRALAGEKAKTEFLATMSHEIRTPLNGLLGNLILLRDTELTEKQDRYVANMETSGRLLMSHISDVLDITKYDAGRLILRPVPMDLSLLLQDIVDSQSGPATANGTTLEWAWDGPASSWIEADRDRIQHILMNIIGNAVKFTHHGRITVKTRVIPNENGLPEAEIRVRDTGIGIDDDFMARIFDDFVTGDSSYGRNVGGTGLGLGIARRFAEALGGQITVESEKGMGSEFCIRFPILQIDAPVEEKTGRKGAKSAAPRNILVVEDNEINRLVVREMLLAAGHKVTEAQNGRIGVDRAQDQRFDLILMDISMPVMDGRAATRAIRAGKGASADVPIVALTASAMAEEQEAFLADGMNDILTKPLNREGLTRMVETMTRMAPQDVAVPENDHLAQLREVLGDDALKGLLARFAAETQELLIWLKEPQDYDLGTLAARCHKAAGSAATFGAVDMRGALLAVEGAAKAGDRGAALQAVAALPAIWDLTRQSFGLGD